jgi:hypothetical protein
VLSRRRIDELHRWGSGLAAAGTTEQLRAAGRAIQLLVDHIEAVELAQQQQLADTPPNGNPENADTASRESVLGALADRIGTRP